MKIAIVTGGASGLGAALSRQLTTEGATVIVADINSADRPIDVSDKHAIAELVNKTIQEHGRLDLMINCAGILSGGAAEELPWERIIEINLGGVIAGSMAAYSVMRQQGFGHILNISSVSALFFAPLHLPYVTSKSAVLGFSIALEAEAARHNVKVSVACPGNIITPMTRGAAVSRFTPAISAEQAAAAVLTGIKRNKRIIVFPLYSKLLWWLERASPALGSVLRRHIVRKAAE
jgi:short-subunit dehydrogenase